MRLTFSKDLHEQRIYAQGNELKSYLARDRDETGKRLRSLPESAEQLVACLQNPVLVTDFFKICTEITDPSVRDTVLALYSSPVRVTEYNGTSLRFVQSNYPTVWGPSIDTLLLCQGLNNRLEGVKTVIELGCGSGFISKYILEHAPSLERIDIVDIDQNAIRCAQDQIKDRRARFQIGNGMNYVENKMFDLVVCNPPYIPRPGSIEENPYEGVGLLHYLLTHSEHLTTGGKVITNFSSLCEGLVNDTIRESAMTWEHLTNMTVPLKVLNVLNNANWMKYLDHKGLHSAPKQGYNYWHTINIIEGRK